MDLHYACRTHRGMDGRGPYTRELHIIVAPVGEARILSLGDLADETYQLWSPQLQTLHWAKYARDGHRVCHGTDWCTTPTAEELAVWDAIAAALTKRLSGATAPRYIRFGSPPRNARSRNHATGEFEAGLSCYRAIYNPISGMWMFAEQATLPTAAIRGALGGYDNALLLAGEEVGVGSDGEPLIANARVLGELTYCRERGGFVQQR